MALSDFVSKEIQQLEAGMRRLSHNTMMGDNGVDESVLIAFGKYRQMKAQRDRWLELRKKQNEPESSMEEMPDDEAESLPPAPAQRPLRRPRSWGGGA
jgi:hypothetical protein